MSRDAFGPNLRRLRLRRQISVEQIADRTKVAANLFHGLERNDFSNWPSGVFARSYIRQYADAVGADPESTVDEFCRWFPQGDRRLARTVREHATIVGHDDLRWQDVAPGDLGERRDQHAPRLAVQPTSQLPLMSWLVRLRRVLGKA